MLAKTNDTAVAPNCASMIDVGDLVNVLLWRHGHALRLNHWNRWIAII